MLCCIGVPVSIGLACLVYYTANVKIPPADVRSPVKLRILIVLYQGFLLAGRWMEWLGLSSRYRVYRFLQNNCERLVSLVLGLNRKTSTDSTISIHSQVFDGVPARIYTPSNPKQGALFYLHGGGWCLGKARTYDNFVKNIVGLTGVTAVSIDYRLAPQHPYPAAFEDCLRAYNHFVLKAESMGVDPSLIVVAGDSSGGNLAAALSQKLRDDWEKNPQLSIPRPPLPILQILIYPCLQVANFNLPSSKLSMVILPLKKLATLYLTYLGFDPVDSAAVDLLLTNSHVSKEFLETDEFVRWLDPYDGIPEHLRPSYSYQFSKDVRTSTTHPEIVGRFRTALSDPYFSPLMAPDLTGLPQTLQITAGLDILRDEALLYKRKLTHFNVPNKMLYLENGFHGFLNMPACQLRVEAEMYSVISRSINSAVNGTGI